MSKKILYVGDGKWCYTEGCAVHTAEARSINPRSEKASAALREQSVITLKSLPNKKDLVAAGDIDKIQQYQQALMHYDDARLHLAISPRGRKALLEKLAGNSISAQEREALTPLFDDSTRLLESYTRAKSRYFYGSSYVDGNGGNVQAIPLSLDNISEVNEWVDSFYKTEPTWTQAPVEDDDEDSEVSTPKVVADPDAPALDKKTKTKIFRKKNKLWYRDHDGNDKEMTTNSYLTREKGKDGFTLVPANSFEDKYTSLMEKKAEPLNLHQIGRERFFPSKKLSEFIIIEG